MKNLPAFSRSILIIIGLASLLSCAKNQDVLNVAPSVKNQSFTIAENSPEGTIIGQVEASDPENEPLTFILSSETNALTIHKTSGVLRVLHGNTLNYETTPVFTVKVYVSDGHQISTSIVTINLTDEPEYALQFDGSDGQITITDNSNLNPTNEITFTMWVRLEEGLHCEDESERAIIIKGFPDEEGSGYNIKLSCDGALSWTFATINGNSLYGTGDMLQIHKWTFLAFVYDGTASGTAIYMDGVKNETGGFDPDQIGSGALIGTTSDLHINERYSPYRTFLHNFIGSIDDVSIWNEALDSDQIEYIMENGIAGTEQGLISYWSCNENYGTRIYDQVSGNDGYFLLNEGVNWVSNP